jgi:spore germination cell wall hydrolase CwlJ-like protein
MAVNDNKISNVIGTHIPLWLLEQLQTRSKKGTQVNRDNANLQYLGNKTGWVRLVSSINTNSQEDLSYFSKLTGLTLTKPEDLSKNFVLYGGVSKYNNQNNKTTYTLRKGFKETYSLLGDQEVKDFGYRPMPGLTRVVIETQGRLGSVRGATIEFKVWDKSQLDVMDALYFKLGYTMFLEWGNTFYYESESSDLKATEFFSLDPFKDKLTKEEISLELGLKRRQSKGNYDGMLGMVSNFSFSYNQEGGYDCVLKLVGLGALTDSIKINQSATLGEQLKFKIEELNSVYRDIQKQKEDKEKAEAAAEAAKLKKAEDAKKEEELNKNFKSYRDFLIADNNEDENQKGGSAIFDVTQAFFNRYASAPSGLAVTSKKKKDFNQEKEYDYYYSPGQKLYIKKFGVILNGTTDIQKTVANISWNSSAIKSRALVGKTAKEISSLAVVFSENNYSIQTQYFSNSNYIVDPPYSGRTPYNFSIAVQFPTTNTQTGKDITYAVTKQDMFQNIVSFFTGESMTYGEMAGNRTNIILPSTGNTTFLSNTLKDRDGNYIAGFFNKKESSGGITFSNDGFYALEITYQYKIPASTWKNTAQLQADGTSIDQENKVKTTISIPVILRITDSDLINGIELRVNPNATTVEYQKYRNSLTNQNIGGSPTENTSPTSNTSSNQTKPAVQYQSSLEATLRSIQIYSLIEAIKPDSKNIDQNRKVAEINLADPKFAIDVFSDGVFKPYINSIITKTLNDSDPFQKNIKYGFNAALLSNKSDSTSIPEVDYSSLLKSYVLPYDVNQDTNEGSRLAHPVYIQLGLLMFILNHCCNLYDKKTNATTTPLLYIDYNPETNFCLSHPCHMTTNGMTFMIPFQGLFEDYKKLFYENVLAGDNIIGTSENKNQTTALFNPEKEDTISGDIPKFKGENKTDAYRGRIMSALVNIDYVFDIVKQFYSQDQTNSVFLKAFVEQILSDMNKTLGNFNIFRFSYDDASNCLQILDDQLVPGLDGEDIVPKDSKFDVPIYGRNSIARSLDLRTDISSKMANVLAISANADLQKKSANSVDGTPYGFINQNYIDRYISNRTENSDIEVTKDKIKLVDANNDAIISSALRFNSNVKDFYSTYNPSTENVGHATNYFIEKLSKNKLDGPTRAAAMIPVSVNFTLDGISGFNMMQGFTISEKFLPYTYNVRNTTNNGVSEIPKSSQKVGFMVTGNVHTIENNEWTTAIKANMTYLKERSEFSGSLNTSLRRGEPATFNPNNLGSSTTTNFVATNSEALAAIENYLGRGKITQADFNALISAIYAEAGTNQEERAWVAAVILNRTRKGGSIGGTTILGTLKKPNQFQAVTGTSANGNSPSQNYVSGPSPSEAEKIYGALKIYLPKIPTSYLYFTANDLAAYGPGTNADFRKNLLDKGGIVIGGDKGTIFSTSA